MNFISKVEAIDSVYIRRMPSSKPIKVARAVTFGKVTILQSENGWLYSPTAKAFCYVIGDFAHHSDWFRALRALGVLTKDQVAAHKAACDEADRKRKLRWAADSLADAARDSGLALSGPQKAFVETHASNSRKAAA